jgi:hypothetical protein
MNLLKDLPFPDPNLFKADGRLLLGYDLCRTPIYYVFEIDEQVTYNNFWRTWKLYDFKQNHLIYLREDSLLINDVVVDLDPEATGWLTFNFPDAK